MGDNNITYVTGPLQQFLYTLETSSLPNVWFGKCSLILWVAFHSPDGVLRSTKTFNFDEIQVIYLFFFAAHTLVPYLESSAKTNVMKTYSFVFSWV